MSDDTPFTEQVRAAWAYFRSVSQSDTPTPDALAQFDRWLAEVKAAALREHRHEWADWISHQGAYVGTTELTQAEIVAALRWEHPPFGCSANPSP